MDGGGRRPVPGHPRHVEQPRGVLRCRPWRAFDETDWDPGLSLQTGVHVKRDQHSTNLRLGLEGYIGRTVMGKFSLDYDRAYLMARIFFDFY
jgi:hypothetical protein